jgi:hypothetical protein
MEMNNKEAEWTDFFNRVFSEARGRIFARYPLEKDESGSPETLAIRDIAAKLARAHRAKPGNASG